MTEPDFTLFIPRADEWMNKNRRRNTHWTSDARQTAAWREAAGWAARAAKLPALGPSHVVAYLHMNAHRRSRIDPSNYNLTACAAVDGLVDVGVWPDDSADWVVGPDMRLGPASKEEALVLHIFGRPCCADAQCLHRKATP